MSAGTSNWYPIVTADEGPSVFLVVEEDVPPDPVSVETIVNSRREQLVFDFNY